MEIEVSHKVPFWLSETRKCTFSHAYILDKGISSFMVQAPHLRSLIFASVRLPQVNVPANRPCEIDRKPRAPLAGLFYAASHMSLCLQLCVLFTDQKC
jgi:hypothetical protein